MHPSGRNIAPAGHGAGDYAEIDHPPIHSCSSGCGTSGYGEDEDGPMRRCLGCKDWYCTGCMTDQDYCTAECREEAWI